MKKERGPLYQEYKPVCARCSIPLGFIVGIDPDRGHAPWDPDCRHRYYCSAHGPMIENVLSKDEIVRNIAKDYVANKMTPNEALDALIKAQLR